jgi:hypothetical protein
MSAVATINEVPSLKCLLTAGSASIASFHYTPEAAGDPCYQPAIP